MLATAAKLRALLPNCPVCGGRMEDHFFGQIASAVIGESCKPLLARFFAAVKRHNWDELATFKEWDANSDNLVAYAIRGGHAQAVVIVVKDVFELYDQSELVIQEALSAEETERLHTEWHPMWA